MDSSVKEFRGEEQHLVLSRMSKISRFAGSTAFVFYTEVKLGHTNAGFRWSRKTLNPLLQRKHSKPSVFADIHLRFNRT